MAATLIPFDESLSGWERALYAFLAEKERRGGSRRAVEGYFRMLQHFFGAVGKPPERVTSLEVFAFAHGVGLSGREPSAVTIGARMACVSSFYRFLIRMGQVRALRLGDGGSDADRQGAALPLLPLPPGVRPEHRPELLGALCVGRQAGDWHLAGSGEDPDRAQSRPRRAGAGLGPRGGCRRGDSAPKRTRIRGRAGEALGASLRVWRDQRRDGS